MERSPIRNAEIKTVLKEPLTNKTNGRQVYCQLQPRGPQRVQHRRVAAVIPIWTSSQ